MKFAVPFHGELVTNCSPVPVIRDGSQFLQQLFKGHRWIDHHRLHIGEVLKVRIEVNRVEDAEGFLADLVAFTRRAA